MSGTGVLADYRDRLARASEPGPVVDEMLDGDTAIDLAVRAEVESLGRSGLWSRAGMVRGLVDDDGITYGTVHDQARSGPWRLDPLPVVLGDATWARLTDGLEQRARLMNLLLIDLYGAQRVLHERVLPADIVFGHPEFLPAAVGALGHVPTPLMLPSVDLARTAGGAWVALGDRMQAPSGAGYALADRRLIARTLPALYRDADLARLRVFFDRLRSSLAALGAKDGDGSGRVVLLSPGSASETAFDQALTASLLGIPVVQAEDLLVDEGRVLWRTGAGNERIDVIVRRVDSTWSDPLELRADSQLGVPGLLEAVRAGAVAVVNPIGSGVLETPALAAYLADLCSFLLDEQLKLAVPQTWWCGDRDAWRSARSRLDSLVIRPGSGSGTRFGWLLSQQELATLAERIDARPWQWTVQEPVTMSTVPVATANGLVPRRFALRTFGVATGDGYEFLAGGLGRVSDHVHNRSISSAAGGVAKDVWVPAGARDVAPSAARSVGSLPQPLHPVPPRVADDLFWLGRYAERAESVVRLLLVVSDLMGDYLDGPASPGQSVMQAMFEAASDLTGRPVTAGWGDDRDPDPVIAELRGLVLDAGTPGTAAFAIDHLVQDAQTTRELLPAETWLVLGRMQRATDPPEDAALRSVLGQMLESLLALGALIGETMARDTAWAFVEAGRRIERALQTIALLRRTICTERPPVIDGQVTEAVLRAADSLATHHRRLASGRGPATPVASAIDLLLRDQDNPRSVAFQLDRLAAAVRRFEDTGGDDPKLPRLRRTLADADPDALCLEGRGPLRALLHDLETRLRASADRIEHDHFTRPIPHRSMSGAELLAEAGR